MPTRLEAPLADLTTLRLGGHFLQAASQAEAPLRSGSDSISAFFGCAGVHGELFLSRAAALTLSLRALAVTPRQGVALAAEQVLLSQPLAQATAGVVVGL